MESGSLWKSPFKIFSLAFFSLVSFVTLLFLFSLFFIGAGFGVGTILSRKSITDFAKIQDKPSSSYSYVSGNKESKNLLLSLHLEGMILGSAFFDYGPSPSFMGVTYGYKFKKALEKAAKNNDVKGIFIHVRTPGGTICGSKAIYDGIKQYQSATKKPVLVFIEGLSASGGVMATAGADAIYADYGSLIGSIGVRGFSLTYFDKPMATQGGIFGGGIVTQGGIEKQVLHAGKGKDLGNPFRKATKEEIENLQKGLDIEYDEFVRHMAINRKMDERVIKEEMGAQIFDNKTAQKYRLIDGTLDKDKAVLKLAEMAGISGKDYKLVKIKKNKRKFFQDILFSMTGIKTRPQSNINIIGKMVKNDICQAITCLPLVYYGDTATLCNECKKSVPFF